MLLSIEAIEVVANVRFDGVDTDGLLSSMRAIGQIVPITVRESENGYVVVAGHRRLAAASQLGWSEIEAYVTAGDSSMAMQIAENVARRDLRPYELAQGVLALKEESRMTQADIAAALGMSKKGIGDLQKVAKGTQGLDPAEMNQLRLEELEVYGEIHDMPAEMREKFVLDVRERGHDYWVVNEYVEDVARWRWGQRKENRVLLKALADIDAIPMVREDTYGARWLEDEQKAAHRGQPCHGYLLRKRWAGTAPDFELDEFCLDPSSHLDAPEPELAAMAKEAVPVAFVGAERQLKQAETTKGRRERKNKRKVAVASFAGKPRMRDLTELMYLFVLDTQREYRWQELGKTFGLAKPADEFHYNWEDYLDDFSGKGKLVQQLTLAIGAWYVALEGLMGSPRISEILARADELFGAEIDHGEEEEE